MPDTVDTTHHTIIEQFRFILPVFKNQDAVKPYGEIKYEFSVIAYSQFYVTEVTWLKVSDNLTQNAAKPTWNLRVMANRLPSKAYSRDKQVRETAIDLYEKAQRESGFPYETSEDDQRKWSLQQFRFYLWHSAEVIISDRFFRHWGNY